MPALKPHEHVHLRAANLDVGQKFRRKHYTVLLMRPLHSGWNAYRVSKAGSPEDYSVCGSYNPRRCVPRSHIEAVTCRHCLAYIAMHIR